MMRRSTTLIPVSKNPPAKVKDKGLIRLARSGAAAYDASGDRILWLPWGMALLDRVRLGLSSRFRAAGAQPVSCGQGPSGTLPVAVRVLKTAEQLPLTLMEESPAAVFLEGYDPEGAFPGWPVYAERLLSFLQERGMELSVFQEALPSGERTLVACGCDGEARGALEARVCPDCGWTASVDALLPPPEAADEEERPLEPVLTPGATTIAELCRQLGCSPNRTIKTMFYAAEKDGSTFIAAALVRGDRAVCPTKLSRALGGAAVRKAESADLKQAGCDVAGFLGPVGLPETVRVIADASVAGTKNRVVGANRPETHLTGACWGRDYEAPVSDISALEPGGACPACGKSVEKGWVRPVADFAKGHPAIAAFPSLGYLDENRKRHLPGVWTGRVLLEAIVLASAGEGDAPFRLGLSPADVSILPLLSGKAEAVKAAENLAEALEERGWAVFLDDRTLPDEVRLAESRLAGCPLQVFVGDDREAEVEVPGGSQRRRIDYREIGDFLETLRVE